MIQRFVHNALTSGFAAIARDITILEDFFLNEYELEREEVAAIRKFFENSPPDIIHGFPRSNTKVPCVAIILGQEGESTNFIGDDGGIDEDPDSETFGADIETALWRHTFQLMVCAEHPDVALYYYELVKHIMLTAGDYFVEKGMLGFEFAGADLMPDPRYAPENLWVRQLTFTAQREFQNLDKSSRLGKAFKVAGIHIDKSGSSGDVGGVKTLVTTPLADSSEE